MPSRTIDIHKFSLMFEIESEIVKNGFCAYVEQTVEIVGPWVIKRVRTGYAEGSEQNF
jgi:hypothetical protein